MKWLDRWIEKKVSAALLDKWSDLERLSDALDDVLRTKKADLEELERTIRSECDTASTQVRNRLGLIIEEQRILDRSRDSVALRSLEQGIEQKVNDPGWLMMKLRSLDNKD